MIMGLLNYGELKNNDMDACARVSDFNFTLFYISISVLLFYFIS